MCACVSVSVFACAAIEVTAAEQDALVRAGECLALLDDSSEGALLVTTSSQPCCIPLAGAWL